MERGKKQTLINLSERLKHGEREKQTLINLSDSKQLCRGTLFVQNLQSGSLFLACFLSSRCLFKVLLSQTVSIKNKHTSNKTRLPLTFQCT